MIVGFWMLPIVAIYSLGAILLVTIVRRHIEQADRHGVLAHCGDDDFDWSWFKRRKPPAQPEPIVVPGQSYRGAPPHTKLIQPRRLRFAWIPGVVIGARIERQDRTTLCLLLLVFELRVVLTQNMVRENEK